MAAKLQRRGTDRAGCFPAPTCGERNTWPSWRTCSADFARQDPGCSTASLVDEAAEYLFCELVGGRRLRRQPHARPTCSPAFQTAVEQKGAAENAEASLASARRKADRAAQFALLLATGSRRSSRPRPTRSPTTGRLRRRSGRLPAARARSTATAIVDGQVTPRPGRTGRQPSGDRGRALSARTTTASCGRLDAFDRRGRAAFTAFTGSSKQIWSTRPATRCGSTSSGPACSRPSSATS